MADSDALTPEMLFRRTLDECRSLYVSSGELCAQEFPHLLPKSGASFVALMDDLHRALVLKIYFRVCEADREWSTAERRLAEVLFEHLWGEKLRGENLRVAACRLSEDSVKLAWYSLVRPFDKLVPLRDRIGELASLVMRLAHLVARCDGVLHPKEAAVIRSIQEELQHHLQPIPVDEPNEHEAVNAIGRQAIEALKAEADDIHAASRGIEGGVRKGEGGGKKKSDLSSSALPVPPSASSLNEVLAELDSLVGLASIKREVRTLTNFLKLRQRREAAGLPDTEMTLHMVFTGNPGTGKTSVARILGKVFGAMGILKKGHLVETDRSGMVAGYAGQTGPKTNAKIDEALDGVLFVDEAYSLVTHDGQDAYGDESVQALLKRSEDDRSRLVVVLAGYPSEMDVLLRSNPGLSSRFNRILSFTDYSPIELAQIFGWLCGKSHYMLGKGVRAKLMLGLTELHGKRDSHFGNGRAVRNLFEHAVRRMANRIADMAVLSQEQLTRLEADDIEFMGVSEHWMHSLGAREPKFRVACPGCSHVSESPGDFLGQKVRCPKCRHDFLAEWGEVVARAAKA